MEDRSHWMRVVFAVHPPLAIPITVWTDLSLAVGQVLNSREVRELEEVAKRAETREIALRYLRYRPRTSTEVVRHLRRKDVDEGTARQVVAELTAEGWMSDEQYVEAYHEAKQTSWSRAQITNGLRQRGVTDELTHEVVNSDRAREAERETARRVAEKYWRIQARTPPDKRLVKLALHLQRRGFPSDVIRRVLNELQSDAWGSEDL